MIIYFIRHGESEGNVSRLLFGSTDYPLTEKGRRDAMEVKEKLRDVEIRRCYCSPMLRAYETAGICFSGTEIPIVCCPQLVEQDMGILENMSFAELVEAYPKELNDIMTNWTAFCPPEGEDFETVWSRATACIDGIIERGEDCAVVAHNGPLSMITAYLLDTAKQNAARYYSKHGCYSAIEIPDNARDMGGTLLFFNK